MDSVLSYLQTTVFATPTSTAFASYLIYYAYICLGSVLVSSNKVKGHPQPKRGPQLDYSINGFRLTLLTIFIVLLFGGVFPQLNAVKLFAVSSLAQ